MNVTSIDHLEDPYSTPLNLYSSEQITQTQASLTNHSKQIHQWMVTHIATSNSLDIISDNFKYGTIQAGID